MEFRKEAPTAQARRLTDRELKGKATAGEVAWLQDNPLLWYRALWRLDAEVNNHTFNAKTRLAELRTQLVKVGERVPQEYLEAKANVEALQRARESFKRKIDERKADAASLMDGRTVRRWLHGDLIMALNDIGYAIQCNDLAGAQKLVQDWISNLSEKEFKPDV